MLRHELVAEDHKIVEIQEALAPKVILIGFYYVGQVWIFLPELGYVSLAAINALKGPLGLPVERDLHFIANKSLSAYAEEARARGRIVA